MKTNDVLEIILTVLGFGMILIGTAIPMLWLMTWIGAWVIVGVIFWYIKKRDKKGIRTIGPF